MADKTTNAVEVLDAEWEKQQAQTDPEPAKEPEAPTAEQPKQEGPKVENKQEHAFKEMRAELAKLKAELEEAKKAKTEPTEQKQAASKKEESEVERLKRELEELKEGMTKKEQTSKIDTINNEVNKLTTELELTDDEMRSIIDQLGTDGYTIDTLLAMPIKSIGKLIKGYAADTVTEKKTQKALASKKKFVEEKHADEPGGNDDPFSADALKKEMEAYARQNKPWLYEKRK